jgi:hypothetical protein
MAPSPAETDSPNIADEVAALCSIGNLDAAEALIAATDTRHPAWSLAFQRLAHAFLSAQKIDRCDNFLSIARARKANRRAIDQVGLEVALAKGDMDLALRFSGRLFSRAPYDQAIALDHAKRLRSAGRPQEAARTEALNQLHMTCGIDQLDSWDGFKNEELPKSGTDLYLDLLERTVCNWICADDAILFDRVVPFDENKRLFGRDIPRYGHTMIGRYRLRHLRLVAEQLLNEAVPGDFLETGVWRGGACILMRGVLAAYGITDRNVIVADSFEGLPAPDPRYPSDELTEFDFHLRPELAVDLNTVRKNFDRYGLLDDQVFFLKGFFRDTLQTLPQRPIALLRLDGDLYSSTMDSLTQLYSRVAVGGYIVIDDYGAVIDSRRATLDFRYDMGISDPMIAIDSDAICWRKS